MVDLIAGKWYETDGEKDRWIFKLSDSDKYKLEELPCSKSSTPNYKYINREMGWIGCMYKNLRFADMKEVYSLFPEEKPKFIKN